MITYKGIEWYYYQGALLPSTPPHIEIILTREEQKELLKLSKARFLRYTNEWDRDGSEFWYIIKDIPEGLETYKSKIRYQIKKGLEACYSKKVDATFLAQHAYEVYKEAFANYKGTHTISSEKSFSENFLKEDYKNKDFFGLFLKEDNKLIGYAKNIINKDIAQYSIVKLHPRYLHYYGSYSLFYEMNEFYLNEKAFTYVSDGARSLSHDTNIQEFLIKKFKFRKAYCRLNVVYRWDVGMVVKFLYPFKKLIGKQRHKLFKKLFVLMKQEEIRRSFVL